MIKVSKFVTTILVLSVLMCLFMPFASANGISAAVNYSVIVNGERVTGYSLMLNEAKNRIFIDAKFFEDFLGAEVETSGDTTVISKNGNKASFKVGDAFFVINDIGSRTLDTANTIENGTAYIPLRFMCESLGAAVGWDQATKTASVTPNAITVSDEVAPLLENLEVYDQASLRITGDATIYVDPVKIVGTPHDADIILLTHTHGDHYSIDSIKNVMKEDTVIYMTPDAVEQAEENGLTNIKTVAPNAEYTEGDVMIKTLPAYNTAPERTNHKKESNWVGYIVTVGDVTYYTAGDTDYLPEMDTVDADVALFPIDGRYNMPATEAARAANAVAPKVAIPYHYNNFMSDNEALQFIDLLDDGITGVLMNFKMY